MANIYLHVGVEKTGTTYLQEFLFINKKKLRGKNYLVPDSIFKEKNHRELACALAFERDLGFLERPDDEFLDNLCFYLDENIDKNIIISSEHLSSRIREQHNELIKILTHSNHKVIIVAFARNPRDWIISKYQEYIKAKGVVDILEFCYSEKIDDYIKYSRDQFRTIYNWKATGSETVIIKYEDGDVLDAFLDAIDLTLENKDDFVYNFEGNKNYALNYTQLNLLKKYVNKIRFRIVRNSIRNILIRLPLKGEKISTVIKVPNEYVKNQTVKFKDKLGMSWE